jgi:plasmid maintenance system antidote protein VapI
MKKKEKEISSLANKNENLSDNMRRSKSEISALIKEKNKLTKDNDKLRTL